MPSDCISYSETNYFSKLILDYLAEKDDLKPFYNRFPKLEEFKSQMQEKGQKFSAENREILVRALRRQYEGLEVSELTQRNIELLSNPNTFTVTTGHQLNLFTGPLYFLYKIVSAINLANELKETYSEHDFVPVYWMATEDHDFEEINYFTLHGKKFQWNPKANSKTGGAVGDLPTDGLEEVFALFSAEIGSGKNAERLKELFEQAYLKHHDLTKATRYLANELFRNEGLVIVDGHDKDLKKEFVPFMEREFQEQLSHKSTLPKAEALQQLGYKIQVNPREINLFYLAEGVRERIVEQDGGFAGADSAKVWSKEELLEELHSNPERFSPNVVMRPLYQEVVLPNLCYIGGGGELAYWFELKDYFEAAGVPFPILLLRNSALLQTEKQDEKRQKLNITCRELFMKQHELINKKVRQISNIDIDLSPQKLHLEQQFQDLYKLAEETDRSFLGAVKAQEVKQLKGLQKLEERLLKAQKRKLEDEVKRITQLQNQLFPNGSLQERQVNFSEFYLEYGEDLLRELKKDLRPLELKFNIFSL